MKDGTPFPPIRGFNTDTVAIFEVVVATDTFHSSCTAMAPSLFIPPSLVSQSESEKSHGAAEKEASHVGIESLDVCLLDTVRGPATYSGRYIV